jgi:hypothetical protein
MPININDLIENLASAAPTIRGAQNQVTGWLYAEVGGTAANGWNIGSAFRDTNSALVSGTSIYIYTGSDTSDGQWQNASNWSEVSGSGGGGIPEAPIDGNKYARQNAGWSTVTDGADGANGLGWTSGSYNPTTGIVTFNSTDGLGFSTTDLRGADGADGSDGSDGAPGTPGTNGSDGADGLGWTSGIYNASTGIVTFNSNDGLGFSTGDLRGADGTNGTNGTNGTDGADGADGSVWFTGSGSPSGATGVDGDFYLDDATGNIWQRGPGGWSLTATNIEGPKGDTGDQGPAGSDGTSVNLLGSVATVGDLPASGNNVGDLYIVLTTGSGATAGDGYAWDGSAWSNVGPIQGPKGDTGDAGADG